MPTLRLLVLLGVISVPPFVVGSCKARDTTIYPVRVVSLYESFRDGGTVWEGRRVSVELTTNTYVLNSEGVAWYARSPDKPFDILFTFSGARPDRTDRRVIITGMCEGVVVRSPLGPSRFVHVSNCTFTMH